MMLVKRQLVPGFVGGYVVSLCRSSGVLYKFFKVFHRIFARLDDQKFFFVHSYDKTFCFLIERENTSDQECANHQQFLHLLFLLLGFVLFLNVDTFSACSPADCNLYESSYYQGCSPTSGNNQYQCGGGSGSCSDVCGGCGWRIRTSGYLQQHQLVLDSLCWIKINASGLSCSRYGSKCTGLRPLRGTFIGLCGVGYESDFDVETICACNDRSSSSAEPSSSSSAEPSSSSSYRIYFPCNGPQKDTKMCYNDKASCTGCAGCGEQWVVDQATSSCLAQGYCSYTTQATSAGECVLFRVENRNGDGGVNRWANCIPCPSSSSTEPSSSSGLSSDSDSSSDSGGGGSDGGESSSGSGGNGESGSGGDGGTIPCGWGDYPPCIVDPIDPPFCQQYPELCYEIGGIDDTLSRYGSAIVDSLGRLIGRLDSLDFGGPGSCLDSADCQPADWSGDSIPYAPGDSAASSGGSGSGSGAAYSWLRAILSAASIPAASRSCPALPKVEFELGGESHSLDLDICKSEFNLAGHHPLELFGLILRAVSAIAAVVIVLGSVTSLNAGFSKMRRLGG